MRDDCAHLGGRSHLGRLRTGADEQGRYQLFLERTGRASMIITNNRDTAERLAMFDDVLLAQSRAGYLKDPTDDRGDQAARR
jgi:hypothetical protein